MTAELESVKVEFDDIKIELSTYNVGEEAHWNSRKKAFIEFLDFYYLLVLARPSFLAEVLKELVAVQRSGLSP